MIWNKRHESAGSFVGEAEVAPPQADQTVEETQRVQDAPAGADLEAFFEALLPMVGMTESTVKEFPRLIRIVPGSAEGEVTVQIDMGAKPYTAGGRPSLERVVTLSVRLDHDYRLLGSGYYCIACDLPQNDTVH